MKSCKSSLQTSEKSFLMPFLQGGSAMPRCSSSPACSASFWGDGCLHVSVWVNVSHAFWGRKYSSPLKMGWHTERFRFHSCFRWICGCFERVALDLRIFRCWSYHSGRVPTPHTSCCRGCQQSCGGVGWFRAQRSDYPR